MVLRPPLPPVSQFHQAAGAFSTLEVMGKRGLKCCRGKEGVSGDTAVALQSLPCPSVILIWPQVLKFRAGLHLLL